MKFDELSFKSSTVIEGSEYKMLPFFSFLVLAGSATASLLAEDSHDFVTQNEYFTKSSLKTAMININSVKIPFSFSPGDFIKFSFQECEANEECVPYYFCDDTDGAGIFNIRVNLDQNVPCESLQLCCETASIKREFPKLKVANRCGYRNVLGVGRYAAVKHNESQFGEFPWMMAVMRKFVSGPSHIYVYTAGGSLIHPSIVLTTAHNVNDSDPNLLTVRGGEWNTQTTDEMLKHVERNVQGITYHKKFTRNNLHNDVALIFLEEPFKMTAHINTVCLPEAEFEHNENCFATGWGKAQFGKKGTYQVFLKKVHLPVVPSTTCQAMLRETRLGEDFILHDGFMCAGNLSGFTFD